MGMVSFGCSIISYRCHLLRTCSGYLRSETLRSTHLFFLARVVFLLTSFSVSRQFCSISFSLRTNSVSIFWFVFVRSSCFFPCDAMLVFSLSISYCSCFTSNRKSLISFFWPRGWKRIADRYLITENSKMNFWRILKNLWISRNVCTRVAVTSKSIELSVAYKNSEFQSPVFNST